LQVFGIGRVGIKIVLSIQRTRLVFGIAHRFEELGVA
jgi:hypothetical protein